MSLMQPCDQQAAVPFLLRLRFMGNKCLNLCCIVCCELPVTDCKITRGSDMVQLLIGQSLQLQTARQLPAFAEDSLVINVKNALCDYQTTDDITIWSL